MGDVESKDGGVAATGNGGRDDRAALEDDAVGLRLRSALDGNDGWATRNRLAIRKDDSWMCIHTR